MGEGGDGSLTRALATPVSCSVGAGGLLTWRQHGLPLQVQPSTTLLPLAALNAVPPTALLHLTGLLVLPTNNTQQQTSSSGGSASTSSSSCTATYAVAATEARPDGSLLIVTARSQHAVVVLPDGSAVRLRSGPVLGVAAVVDYLDPASLALFDSAALL